jgi:hypothetical protein
MASKTNLKISLSQPPKKLGPPIPNLEKKACTNYPRRRWIRDFMVENSVQISKSLSKLNFSTKNHYPSSDFLFLSQAAIEDPGSFGTSDRGRWLTVKHYLGFGLWAASLLGHQFGVWSRADGPSIWGCGREQMACPPWRVFIWVSARTCMNIYIYTIFLKK